jgi:hypothetical protein
MVRCVEFVMSADQSNRTWQADLVARYQDLFHQEFHGRVTAPGFPSVGDGWRDLVETAIGRIATAVAAAPNGSLKIGQIKEKFATLRVYLDSRKGLPDSTNAAIDEAIELGEARSACTCETCGEPGRLFKSGGWYLTACDEHGKGEAVMVQPGRENLHITRTLQDGKLSIASCRRYIRETDSFVDVSPADLGIKE